MIIVDSNVLLDAVDGGGAWFDWSIQRLHEAGKTGLIINAIIYAEIAPTLATEAALESFLIQSRLHYEAIPRPALFEAGRAHARYRENGGRRDRILPDFLIGAHAAFRGCDILTRDPSRYRTYFSDVRLITP